MPTPTIVIRYFHEREPMSQRKKTRRSRSGGMRRLRPALEQLETRAVLTGVPPDLMLNISGTVNEGSNEPGPDQVTEWTVDLIVFDPDGGTYDFGIDLNGDGDFDDLDEVHVLNVTVPSGAFVQMIDPTPVSWEAMQLAGIADSDPSDVDAFTGSFEYPIAAIAIEHPLAGPIVYSNATPVPVNNSMPFFDFDEDTNEGAIDVDQGSGGGSGCSGGGNSHVTVAGTFTEYGINDAVTLEINWGDGTIDVYDDILGDIFELAGRLSNDDRLVPFSFEHDYEIEDEFDITLKIWDDEGTFQNVDEVYGSKYVYDLDPIVLGGPSGPSVCLNDDGVLTVNGSAGNDTVTITRPNGQIHVESSFFPSQNFAANSVANIVVQLGDGDDELLVTANKPLVAVGGDGSDSIRGGPARSILIGGAGADLLHGGSSEDILVDGETTQDDYIEALLAMLAEWNSDHSFTQRVLNLTNAPGAQCAEDRLNGNYFLVCAGNDAAIDQLIGGGSMDWIIRHLGDRNVGPFDFVT